MKKILHVLYSMDSGGIEQFLLNLVNENSISQKNVQMDFLLWKPHNQMKKELEDCGAKIILVNNPRENFYKFAKSSLKIFKSYDVVHLHSDYFNGVLSVLARSAGVKKIISHSHTIDDGKRDGVIRCVYRRISKFLIIKNSDELIGCSVDASFHLFGRKNMNSKVVFNGINTRHFIFNKENYLKQELYISEETFLMGHIGRFSIEKNHIRLIKIFKVLKDEHQNAHLVLIGDGPLKPEILKLIEIEGLQDSIHLLGVRSDIVNILKSVDLFVLPSKFEGLPLTIIEAQAAGTKIAMSNNIPADVEILKKIILRIDLRKSNKKLAKELWDWHSLKVEITEEDRLESLKPFDIKEVYEELIKNNY